MSLGRSWALPILVAGGAAVLVSVLGATVTQIGPWYEALAKPPWNPPDAAFPIAWTIIYAFTAVAAATAWRHAPSIAAREWLIGLFALNGALNIGWSLLFFRLQRPDYALAEVVLLWLSILLIIIVVGRYSRTAALLMLPYLVWVAFAAFLNLTIVRLNPAFG